MSISKRKNSKHRKPFWQSWWLQALVVLGAVIILLPQFSSFLSSDSSLLDLDWWLLTIGFAVFMCSAFFAALVYYILVSPKLPIARTTLVQIAAGFANRLLPSGIGNIGLNTFYLAKQCRMKKLKAAAIATTNNFIGFLAYLVVATILAGGTLFSLGDSLLIWKEPLWVFIILFSILLLLLIINGRSRWRSNIERSLRVVYKSFEQILSRPWRLIPAVAASACITLCYIGALMFSAQAAGVSLPLHELIIVFSAGVGATAISPTPNGLGAVELAMTFALASLGYATAVSLLIVIGYRLITFWLPIIPGFIAFRILTKKSYI